MNFWSFLTRLGNNHDFRNNIALQIIAVLQAKVF